MTDISINKNDESSNNSKNIVDARKIYGEELACNTEFRKPSRRHIRHVVATVEKTRLAAEAAGLPLAAIQTAEAVAIGTLEMRNAISNTIVNTR